MEEGKKNPANKQKKPKAQIAAPALCPAPFLKILLKRHKPRLFQAPKPKMDVSWEFVMVQWSGGEGGREGGGVYWVRGDTSPINDL